MEKFIRNKVAVGEYETASEVVREALRLLRHRDEVWKNEVRGKIKEGLDSIQEGHTLSVKEVQAEMAAFKRQRRKANSAR